MTETGADEFAALLARCAADSRVVGVVLSGSQAREGTATVRSDYDVLVVVTDEAEGLLSAEHRRDARLDVSTMPLREFRTHALPGSGSEWNRYAFTRSKVLNDTAGGLIAELVKAKAELSPTEADQLASDILDAFLNGIYRCLKNDRDGNAFATLLDGAESVPHFLTYIFAVNHRVRPYNKYLAWELERFPLPQPEWALANLTPLLTEAHSARAPQAVRSLFRTLEPHARSASHGDVVDSWGDDLHLMRG